METTLTNTVTANGTYDSVPTALTATIVTQLVDGLTLTKTADKEMWADGTLLYTITINNTTELDYENPVLTDILDISKISLDESSITINGTPATGSDYTYDSVTGTLTITLDVVEGQSTSAITFRVEKV